MPVLGPGRPRVPVAHALFDSADQTPVGGQFSAPHGGVASENEWQAGEGALRVEHRVWSAALVIGIHDLDAIYAPAVDRAIRSMGLRVLKTPARTPQANAFCERVIGTIWRECLDWLIPPHERHLRGILREWVPHCNRGRPHSSLGPGIPEPSPALIRPVPTGYRLPTTGCRVIATPVLNGLHHECQLGREAA